jgi:hypothetical protein
MTWTPPQHVEGRSLLEQGLLCVLVRHLSEAQGTRAIDALRAAFPDWNELRVCQVQEFQHLIPSKDAGTRLDASYAIKDYLQEIYQRNHGFDIEHLKSDVFEAGKFIGQLTYLGASAGHWLVWRSSSGAVPTSPGMVRLLDRLGIIHRQASPKKIEPAFSAAVPPELRETFSLRFGRVIELWCDAKRPICWECPLVDSCAHGKRVLREYKASQKRLEQQKKRDEERRAMEAEKERRRLEAEARKRAAADAKRAAIEAHKRKREQEKRAREEARRRAVEDKARQKAQREAEKRRFAEQKRREAERKKAEAKKRAEARKRPSRSARSAQRGGKRR